MTGCYAVLSSGGLDLIKLYLTIFMACFSITGLKVASAAAAAVIIGFVRGHVNKVFFTNNRFDNKTEIFSHRIAQRLSNQLTGILNRKGDLKVFIPVGIDLELAIPDPLGVKLDNAL